jgi:cell division protein ZapE
MLIDGSLSSDPSQAVAIERLQALWFKLRGYDPQPRQKSTALWRVLRRKPVDEAPRDFLGGLYLVGDVGRGKSMLMDLFFAAADVRRRRRTHFHQFMQDVHARIHVLKKSNPGTDDPIPPLADALASEAALLCFDEFQVNDIADALILGRLFQALFDRMVVVVATSNTTPDDLFRDRPGRDAFLPFIAILKQHLDVLVMDGQRDWRRQHLQGVGTWHVPVDGRADAAVSAAFAKLTGGEPVHPDRLMVMGRTLEVPRAANGVARFSFGELCEAPLGAGDYLALATHFHALVLDHVPHLSPDNYDAARRFITLIDALYDHRVKLVASAATLPDDLYQVGEGAKAFERTASRLIEMQSAGYLASSHLT